ncbi:hypothetical protein DLS39_13345 [Staphylococcus pseudintermedius]|nr:hypothetical protein [Staphylococcus pseudintermedius]RYR80836.1 hypothetical protein DLS60_13300 [Staphylococcus pseudintermedius]RYR89061.1 hypothetical protein DLS56_13345 [Staphylococcus pseudintermedius]RYS04446.1 hypothetical protein DLS55_08925 [Staphylococcus pseudintermedius]RYS15025.1 hypothetical protein DLS50_08855 [Staphylococcus pseudintermedius]
MKSRLIGELVEWTMKAVGQKMVCSDTLNSYEMLKLQKQNEIRVCVAVDIESNYVKQLTIFEYI